MVRVRVTKPVVYNWGMEQLAAPEGAVGTPIQQLVWHGQNAYIVQFEDEDDSVAYNGNSKQWLFLAHELELVEEK